MNKDSKRRPSPLAITMGCPAGIGPEIIIKYFHGITFENRPQSVVIGDINILAQTADNLQLRSKFHRWNPGDSLTKNVINVFTPSPSLDISAVTPGHPTLETGKAMAGYIEKAIELCLQGSLSGMTTCPISKTSLNGAGYDYPGHTEFLANRTGATQAVMMMAGSKLNIVLATIHCSLLSVPSLLSQQLLTDLIDITNRTLQVDFNIPTPKIAVAGLNPHAGEDGLFGNEEQAILLPVIKSSAKRNLCVQGPFPPDTVFNKAVSGEFDVVICMYHDQGLIPFKLLHFEDGVNVTLGLPIVRTSVDHGTAYDIAGQGRADYRSLQAAAAMAAMIAENRYRHNNQ